MGNGFAPGNPQPVGVGEAPLTVRRAIPLVWLWLLIFKLNPALSGRPAVKSTPALADAAGLQSWQYARPPIEYQEPVLLLAAV